MFVFAVSQRKNICLHAFYVTNYQMERLEAALKVL